jgi:hypothetical protein
MASRRQIAERVEKYLADDPEVRGYPMADVRRRMTDPDHLERLDPIRPPRSVPCAVCGSERAGVSPRVLHKL